MSQHHKHDARRRTSRLPCHVPPHDKQARDDKTTTQTKDDGTISKNETAGKNDDTQDNGTANKHGTTERDEDDTATHARRASTARRDTARAARHATSRPTASKHDENDHAPQRGTKRQDDNAPPYDNAPSIDKQDEENNETTMKRNEERDEARDTANKTRRKTRTRTAGTRKRDERRTRTAGTSKHEQEKTPPINFRPTPSLRVLLRQRTSNNPPPPGRGRRGRQER